jgi:uncharacterized protein
MAILIDASVFYALANYKDVHNKKAIELITDIFDNKYGEPFTTNFIFDEVVNVTMRKEGKKKARLIGQHLLESEVHMINLNRKVFKKAWQLFQSNNSLSFTDCTSVALAQLADVKHIATFDKEFKRVKGIEVVDA